MRAMRGAITGNTGNTSNTLDSCGVGGLGMGKLAHSFCVLTRAGQPLREPAAANTQGAYAHRRVELR